MLRQGVGGEERARWTEPARLQCPLLAVKAIKNCLGEMSKYSPHILRSKNTVWSLPGLPQRDQLSMMALLFGLSFIPQMIYRKASAF